MSKDKHLQIIALILIILLQLAGFFSFASQKQGYFLDEIYSYSLANVPQLWSTLNELSGKWIEPEQILKLVEVSGDNRFSYDAVFYNQSTDVHPPFYYLILHTVSSFFPESFSKWYGLSINISLFVLCHIVLFMMSKKLVQNPYLALLPGVIWGFSAGAISTVLFIRMYMLLTTLVTILTFSNWLLIENGPSRRNYALIFLTTLLGFLTHYYFLIYIFFLAVLVFIYLFMLSQWRGVLGYASTVLSGLIAGVLIFPHAIHQIFHGSQGTRAFAQIIRIRSNPFKLINMASLVSKQQFGGFLLGLTLILISLVLIVQFIRQKSHIKHGKGKQRVAWWEQIKTINLQSAADLSIKHFLLISLLISVTATFTLVSIVNPYQTTRYLYFIYPLISLLAVFFMWQVGSLVIRNQKVLMLAILLIFAILNPLSYRQGQVEFLYAEYDQILATAQNYADFDCVYVTNRPWFLSNIFEFSTFRRVFILRTDNMAALEGILSETINTHGMMLYIDQEQDHGEIITEILSLSSFEGYSLLYTQDFSSAYLVK